MEVWQQRGMLCPLCLLASTCCFVAGGCSMGPKAPLEVAVFRGEDRRPVSNAEVRIAVPRVGIFWESGDYSSHTTAEGIARFSSVPIRGLVIDVCAEGDMWRTFTSVCHPQEVDCRTFESIAEPLEAPLSGKNQLRIELRCTPVGPAE